MLFCCCRRILPMAAFHFYYSPIHQLSVDKSLLDHYTPLESFDYCSTDNYYLMPYHKLMPASYVLYRISTKLFCWTLAGNRLAVIRFFRYPIVLLDPDMHQQMILF